jgi:hypothetical protein
MKTGSANEQVEDLERILRKVVYDGVENHGSVPVHPLRYLIQRLHRLPARLNELDDMPPGLDHGASDSRMLAYHAHLPVAQLVVELGLGFLGGSCRPPRRAGGPIALHVPRLPRMVRRHLRLGPWAGPVAAHKCPADEASTGTDFPDDFTGSNS